MFSGVCRLVFAGAGGNGRGGVAVRGVESVDDQPCDWGLQFSLRCGCRGANWEE